MGRSKGGVFEGLMRVATVLPTWFAVLLAVVAYLGLHIVASMDMTQSGGSVYLAAVSPKLIFRALASYAQYVLPAVFLLGAVASLFARRRRAQLLDHTASGQNEDSLNGISWREFELLVGEAYRRKGFTVRETGGGGADGGVDLVLTKNGQTALVQCKQWKTFRVGVKTVRELYGVMTAQHANGGVIVTSGDFTQEARDFAAGKNIELVDGEKLQRVINLVRSVPGTSTTPPRSEQSANVGAAGPVCPKCGIPMVKRTAKRGNSVGHNFWGCADYPRCRGIVPIREIR